LSSPTRRRESRAKLSRG